MAYPMCYLLLNDTVDLQLPSISTLVPQGSCSVFIQKCVSLLTSNF